MNHKIADFSNFNNFVRSEYFFLKFFMHRALVIWLDARSIKKFLWKIVYFILLFLKIYEIEIEPKISITLRILELLMLQVMANFKLFQAIYQ